MRTPDAIINARSWLAHAQSIAVLTGAGVSAESGVPTFRGPGGLWKTYRAEDLATPGAFARNPQLVWEWYAWRRQVLASAQPNAGHATLVDLERRARLQDRRFTLITQNVDGLHTLAGSENVVKIHGDIWDVRCTRCNFAEANRRAPFTGIPPLCTCGALLRPGVVWFGEALPEAEWQQAQAAVKSCDVLLVAGTSAVVYPAAGLIDQARHAKVIEVNLEATPFSDYVNAALRGPAGRLLTELITG